MSKKVEVAFPAGNCPIWLFGELEDRSRPIILFFMDGFGPRPALFEMAERMASWGYRVVLPNLFYRHADEAALTVKGILSGGEDRKRLSVWMGELDQGAIEADISALLAFTDTELGASVPIAATGYCLGGRFSLTAATLSPRVAFAASFHGSNLALAEGASVHDKLEGVKARIYIGVAEHDHSYDGPQQGRLAAALRAAHADHLIENYAGAQHGFALADLPMHNVVAAERHWRRLAEGLNETIAALV